MSTSRIGVRIAAVSTCTLLLTSCGDGERVVRATRDVEVTTTRGEPISSTHEAPSLLTDRADRDVVYLSEVELQSGDCRFYVSTNGGHSWERREASPTIPPYTNCNFGSSQPQNIRTELVQAPDGTIYYAFAANDPSAGGTRSVLLARSNNRGESWETTVVHAGPKAAEDPMQIEVNFEMHVAIDPQNPQRIVAMWRRSFPRVPGREQTPPTRPFMAISRDGGRSFEPAFMMLDKNIGFDGPRPIIVGDRLYAFYRESLSNPSRSRVLAGVSTDEGKTWQETEIAAAADASEPIPLYDRERERFHVVWHDNRHGDLDVFFSSSQDTRNWSEPRRLNNDQQGNRIGQYYPQLSLSDDGRIDVSWYDYRDDTYPAPTTAANASALTLGSNLGKFQSVYYTSSDDGGTTWLPNLRVNDTLIDRTIGTWNGEFFVVVPTSIASAGEEAVVAWSDTRQGNADTGTQDIFTSVITRESEDDTEISGAVWVAGGAGILLGAGLAMLLTLFVLRRQSREGREESTSTTGR